MHWIYDLSLWALAALLLSLSVLYAAAAVILVRRRSWRLDADDNASAAALHAFIGVLYAVALGLMVAAAQSDNSDVEMAVSAEANAAGNLFRVAAGLDSVHARPIQRDVARYVELVIHHEWPATQHARTSLPTWRAMDRLAREIYTFVPATPQEERVYPKLVEDVEDLLNARRVRLDLGQHGVGAVTWVVIVIGGLITIGFPAFFRMASLRAHLLLACLAAAMFGLMIFLLLAMDHPLWGRVSVQPDPFVELQQSFLRQHQEEVSPQP